MISQQNRRTISSLLIVAMLNLLIFSIGGSVMAMPANDSKMVSVAMLNQVDLACDIEAENGSGDLQKTAPCSACQESSCASCMQLSLLVFSIQQNSVSAKTHFFSNTFQPVISLRYTPPQRPPKLQHSS